MNFRINFRRPALMLGFVFCVLVLNAQENNHTFYLQSSYNIPTESSMYLTLKNPDYEAWSNISNRFSYGVGYSFGLNKFLNVGFQFETETVAFSNFSVGENTTAKRNVAGVHFEAKYPASDLHFICGGFFNTGSLKSNDFDFKFSGLEYGIYLGPEYSYKHFNLALEFGTKFSYFHSKKTDAESVLILNPTILLKLGYSLSALK